MDQETGCYFGIHKLRIFSFSKSNGHVYPRQREKCSCWIYILSICTAYKECGRFTVDLPSSLGRQWTKCYEILLLLSHQYVQCRHNRLMVLRFSVQDQSWYRWEWESYTHRKHTEHIRNTYRTKRTHTKHTEHIQNTHTLNEWENGNRGGSVSGSVAQVTRCSKWKVVSVCMCVCNVCACMSVYVCIFSLFGALRPTPSRLLLTADPCVSFTPGPGAPL